MNTGTEVVLHGAGSLAKADWVAKRDAMLADAAMVDIVDNDEKLEWAGRLQAQITKHVKALAEERLALTRPIEALKKDIIAQEKELAADLDRELERIKRLNSDYATFLAKKAEEARRQAELEARRIAEMEFARRVEAEAAAAAADAAGEEYQPMPEPEPIQSPQIVVPSGPKTSANSFVEKWEFEIIDPNAVPREFCAIDDKKIRAWLQYQKSSGADIERIRVDGLRLYKTMSVRSR